MITLNEFEKIQQQHSHFNDIKHVEYETVKKLHGVECIQNNILRASSKEEIKHQLNKLCTYNLSDIIKERISFDNYISKSTELDTENFKQFVTGTIIMIKTDLSSGLSINDIEKMIKITSN